jgi:C4-dicarboxylate transporter
MAYWILVAYGIIALAVVVALAYFFVKRIYDKKNETFERRKN